MKPLEGSRVIDMTHVLAGPYCGYQLGLLGADVIKVESPYGDMIRLWGDDQEQLNHGLTNNFAAQNAGKRSICVNIKRPEGAEIVRNRFVIEPKCLHFSGPKVLQKYVSFIG